VVDAPGEVLSPPQNFFYIFCVLMTYSNSIPISHSVATSRLIIVASPQAPTEYKITDDANVSTLRRAI